MKPKKYKVRTWGDIDQALDNDVELAQAFNNGGIDIQFTPEGAFLLVKKGHDLVLR